MNKTAKNILMSPVNLLVWINHQPAETMLIFIFISSLFPFIGIHVDSQGFLGGLIAFFALISEKYLFRREKTSDLFNILGIILLITGVVSLFIVGTKNNGDSWSLTELSVNTYFGAFFGMMLSAMIISFQEDKAKEKNKIKKEQEQYEAIRKRNLEIKKKEESGFIAIRSKDGQLSGYIKKSKYDEFIATNLIKE